MPAVLIYAPRLISIHAPSRERRVSAVPRCGPATFQSTLPHGSDNCVCRASSIFAYFNPRSLTGATSLRAPILLSNLFQSTLPHGSDHAGSAHLRTSIDFNPRSLTGATPCHYAVLAYRRFQSTLPHGSDGRSFCWRFAKQQFQSTLPHGSDNALTAWDSVFHLFQSTLPHGSDSHGSLSHAVLLYFNPRSLTGATVMLGRANENK